MYFYSFNIGDYQTHTGHLTVPEDCAYRRLLDWLYLHEKPVPSDYAQIGRLIRMPDDLEAVTAVLDEFFIAVEDGYTHPRVLAELGRYHATKKINAKAGKASGKARRAAASERAFNSVEPTNNQEPITNNQEPITNKVKTPLSSTTPNDDIPVQKIVDLFHEVMPELPRMEKITNARRGHIQQRWREDLKDLDQWRNYFNWIRESDFLMGRKPGAKDRPPFIASLEWITKPANFAKISEGNYHGY